MKFDICAEKWPALVEPEGSASAIRLGTSENVANSEKTAI